MHLRTPSTLLAAALIAVALTSCASVNRHTTLTAQPPKEEACRTSLKREICTLNLPISASTAELAETLNRLTAKGLYRGSTKTNGVSADVLRNGPIAIKGADNFLLLTVPISIRLNYGIFETPPLSTTLKFRVKATVTPDWRLNTECYYTGMTDALPAELRIGPMSMKPRGMMESMTLGVQRTLSNLISKKLNETFPLKAQVAKAWTAAQKPILIDKQYSAWLLLSPREVLLNPLQARNDRVSLSVGLRSYAEVVVGPEPLAPAPLPLPSLKLVNSLDGTFRVAVNTELFYRDVVRVASPLLLNKELGKDGKSIIIRDLDLYGNGHRVMVKVTLAGSVDGTFYLTGKPVLDPQTGIFSVQDVDFDMESKSLLLTTADWLLHGTLRDRIQEKLNVDLAERIGKAREMAGKKLQRVHLAENLFLAGEIKSLKLNDLMVQKEKILIQLYGEGETAIVFH